MVRFTFLTTLTLREKFTTSLAIYIGFYDIYYSVILPISWKMREKGFITSSYYVGSSERFSFSRSNILDWLVNRKIHM